MPARLAVPASLAALAVLALAGCIAPAHPGGDGGAGEGPSDLPGLAAGPLSFALTPAMGLAAPGAGEAGAVPLRWAWREWLEGTDPPTWVGEPLAAPVLVTNASVTVHLVAAKPTAGTQQRPELTAWWGPDRARVHHAFLDGPDVLLPGQEVHATLPLEVPLGGLAVDRGQRLELSLATYYLDSMEVASLDLLLDEAGEGTRLDLVVEPLVLAPAAPRPLLDETGALEGGRCLGLGAVSPNGSAMHAVEVPAEARGLRVVLERPGGTGPPDLDFAVLGPAGEPVGRGQGPGPHEELTLREANLAAGGGPGAWEVVVYNCTPQASQYRLTVEALVPQGDAAGA